MPSIRLTSDLARSVVLVLTGGFALLLGVVPFHIWIGPMAEESPPIASVFVLAVSTAQCGSCSLTSCRRIHGWRLSRIFFEPCNLSGC